MYRVNLKENSNKKYIYSQNHKLRTVKIGTYNKEKALENVTLGISRWQNTQRGSGPHR